MVGANNTAEEDSTYLRKIRKPIVEKKRRDRMNHSIYQLETLIAHTIQHYTVPFTRIDKAEILELTVFHLTQLQQSLTYMPTHVAAYRTGFTDCAREAVRYLSENLDVSEFTVSCLNSHLHRELVAQQSRLYSHNELILLDKISSPLGSTDNRNSSSTGVGVTECSPVQTYVHPTLAMLGSFVPEMARNSAFSSYDSSFNNPNSLNASNSSSCDRSFPNYNSNCNTDSGKYSKMVGVDEEIEVGHVINDTIWRPW